MSVGLPATKNEIDTRSGDIARAFQAQFQNVLTMKGYLDQTDEATLIAMGYDANDVATLKTAFADLFQLAQIWSGQSDLSAAKDFRQFVQRLWGVGSF